MNKLRYSFRFFLCLTFFAAFLACKTTTPSSSLKWGHLKDNKDKWLIQLEPGDDIIIVGNNENKEEVVEAVKIWAKAIKRDTHLNIINGDAPGAVDRNKENNKVFIFTSDPLRDASWCEGMPDNILAFADFKNMRITLCKYLQGVQFKNVILHEAGHFWGMCDQYEKGGDLTNCDMDHSIQRNNESIMGTGTKIKQTVLASDDLTGIRKLTCRSDIPSNKKWEKLVGSFSECSKYRFIAPEIFCKYPDFDKKEYYRTGEVIISRTDDDKYQVQWSYHLSGWPDRWSEKVDVASEKIAPYFFKQFDDNSMLTFFEDILVPASKNETRKKWQIENCVL